MPIPTAWRAQQTTDTTGTGTLTLNAADGSRRSLYATLGSSSVAALYLISQSGATSWEVNAGTFNGADPGTLTRGTCLASSNGGSPVSWGVGRKDVILLSVPGQRLRVAVSGSATAALADLGGLLDYTGAGGHTLTLPAAASVPSGMGYLIRNSGSAGAVLTIDGNASEQVGGSASQIIFRGESLEVWSNGAGWIHSPLPPLSLIQTKVPTVATAVDFVLPSSATTMRYEIAMESVVLSSAGQLLLRTSTDGGSSFAASGSDYGRSYVIATGASTLTGANDSGDAIFLSTSGPVNNLVRGNGQFFPGDGAFGACLEHFACHSIDAGGSVTNRGSFSGNRVAAGAVNAIRFTPSSGNFAAAGFISLYARRY